MENINRFRFDDKPSCKLLLLHLESKVQHNNNKMEISAQHCLGGNYLAIWRQGWCWCLAVHHDRDGASVQGVHSTQYSADHRVFIIAAAAGRLGNWV